MGLSIFNYTATDTVWFGIELSNETAGFKFEMKHLSANILDIDLNKELSEINVTLIIIFGPNVL